MLPLFMILSVFQASLQLCYQEVYVKPSEGANLPNIYRFGKSSRIFVKRYKVGKNDLFLEALQQIFFS